MMTMMEFLMRMKMMTMTMVMMKSKKIKSIKHLSKNDWKLDLYVKHWDIHINMPTMLSKIYVIELKVYLDRAKI